MNLVFLILLIFIVILLLILIFKKSNSNLLEEKILLRFDEIDRSQQRTELMLKEEISRNKQEINNNVLAQIDSFLRTTQQEIDILRRTVETQLQYIKQENTQKLTEIKEVVEEKLQSTLETRLGGAFKQVSDRLELLYKNLGEIQSLANTVGDLNKVLSNIKTRGILGEIQLKNILEDILTPEQYLENVNIKEKEFVEFVVKIPSKDEENKYIFLPIDAKFPVADYEKLIEAIENANSVGVEEAKKSLERRILQQAKDIKEKYISPPKTTDFAIMFLPTEGIFAEVLRIPGLFERIRKEFNVIITGPTTISAILNSLQMGFRTLAIEKRSAEVWRVLAEVKQEFSKFGELLEKTNKKLQEATTTIEQVTSKTKTIQRKLKDIETLPAENKKVLIEGNVVENE